MKKSDVSMKPAEYAEFQLVDGILTGEFAVDTFLPGERELAEQLGVTRPTLREVLQRMAKDGWIEIQHGKATRIKNYLVEGNLGVFSSIVQHQEHITAGFTANLLVLRRLVAPDYTRLAIEHDNGLVIQILQKSNTVPDLREALTCYDWELHHQLAVESENPVFPLLLNGFAELYHRMGLHYFAINGAIALSRRFYAQLLQAALDKDSLLAESICRNVMIESEQLWDTFANNPFSGKEGTQK